MSIDKNKEAERIAEQAAETVKRLIKDAYFTGWSDCSMDMYDRATYLMQVSKEGAKA